ncbi:hypothetical protein N7508_008401, partial [Penicillium antarcticum]|uniref:uncharacterized protein n=1 Tax=Penicillium antarcticum TaxID=416450 RepID=UPI00238238C3
FYGFILLFWIRKAPGPEPRDFDRHPGIISEPHPLTPDQAVKNRTLGFERIFVIGLSDRTDKRDAITLISSFLGVDIEWIDGVKQDDINPKAYPSKPGHHLLDRPNTLGSWRAHMNALQTMIARGYSSALILEDDSDWDVSFKDQMVEFARGARAISTKQDNPHSPYGDSWDLLWLGHCSSRAKKGPYWKIPNDPTVAPLQYRTGFKHPSIIDEPDAAFSRYIYLAEDLLCSYGIAWTLDAARNALARMSMLELDVAAADVGFHVACDGGLRCLTSEPALIGSYRRAGPPQADSDIEIFESTEWHEAGSGHIVWSSSLNALRLAAGSTVKAQWPEITPPEIDPMKLKIPKGHLEDLS